MPCSRRNINSPGTGWLGIEGYGGSITDSELDLSEENTNRIETKTTHSFTMRWSTMKFVEEFVSKEKNGEPASFKEFGVCQELQ
jgi:hypothetical protein